MGSSTKRTSLKNFDLEWSDPIFHRVSVMEVAISSMVSKTFKEKLFSRNEAFPECSGNELNGYTSINSY